MPGETPADIQPPACVISPKLWSSFHHAMQEDDNQKRQAKINHETIDCLLLVLLRCAQLRRAALHSDASLCLDLSAYQKRNTNTLKIQEKTKYLEALYEYVPMHKQTIGKQSKDCVYKTTNMQTKNKKRG